MNLKYFAIVVILIVFLLVMILIPLILTLEAEKNQGKFTNMIQHRDSCTRWEFWNGDMCQKSPRFSHSYQLMSTLQKITIPFVGAAGIFVLTITTPRISKLKRAVMIIPCSVLLGISLLMIFTGIRW